MKMAMRRSFLLSHWGSVGRGLMMVRLPRPRALALLPGWLFLGWGLRFTLWALLAT